MHELLEFYCTLDTGISVSCNPFLGPFSSFTVHFRQELFSGLPLCLFDWNLVRFYISKYLFISPFFTFIFNFLFPLFTLQLYISL